MKAFAAAALGLVLSVQAGFAAEPVFPPASRIGLVPPEEMTVSKRFSGFENPEKAAAINFVEMPADAYQPLVNGLTKDALKRQGMSETSRENLKIGTRTGISDRRHHDRAGGGPQMGDGGQGLGRHRAHHRAGARRRGRLQRSADARCPEEHRVARSRLHRGAGLRPALPARRHGRLPPGAGDVGQLGPVHRWAAGHRSRPWSSPCSSWRPRSMCRSRRPSGAANSPMRP